VRVLGTIEVDGPAGSTRLRGHQAMLLAQIAATYPNAADTATIDHGLWAISAHPTAAAPCAWP
jgi:hypothetical protein